MANPFTIAMAQLNPVVGDLAGNADKLIAAYRDGSSEVDLLVAPELYLSGYPPEDLVMRRGYHRAVQAEAQRIAKATADGGAWIITGAPWAVEDELYNAALVIGDGSIQDICRKSKLPNYGVFDEMRVFSAGPLPAPVSIRGIRIAALICEDIWSPDPVEAVRQAGAEILVAINGSPYDIAKLNDRREQAVARVREARLPLVYINQVGGQDELVFDGSSFVLNSEGSTVVQLPPWQATTVAARFTRAGNVWCPETGPMANLPDELEMTYHALVYGLRDYTTKNGFGGIVIGLSGGVDSALSAAIAVDALGAENIRCVMLPSVYTSEESITDAADCAVRLGTTIESLSIQAVVEQITSLLHDVFEGRAPDSTEENIQARARAVILMALSNKFGYMLLTTGNKSEISVGYTTLYGDMSGGFSVLKDVYKTRVYELARWRNENVPEDGMGPAGPVIPDNILQKAPTAELRPDQSDQDTLPSYDQLDAILYALVDEERAVEDVVCLGYPLALVAGIENMIYGAEYKRRQAPPGVRISRRNFDRERRYPITNHFREG